MEDSIGETSLVDVFNQSKEGSLIRRQYMQMQERLAWLECLEGAGVDNWSGIDYAHEMYEEEV